MCVWDVNPGSLDRQSLLGEHRDMYAMVSLLTERRGMPGIRKRGAGPRPAGLYR
jgi:Pyrimidine dimer DNA glycosylase